MRALLPATTLERVRYMRKKYKSIAESDLRTASERSDLSTDLSGDVDKRKLHLEALNSRWYKLGHVMKLPLRILNTIYRKTRHAVGVRKNLFLLHKHIDDVYGIERNYLRNKIKVNLVIRSYHHPTSSTFIRLIAPLSYGSFRRKLDVRFVDGERYKLQRGVRIVVVQRTAIPSLDIAKQLVSESRQKNALLFVDTDDAFGELDRNHHQYELQKERVNALDYIINNSDDVWFSTKELQKLYSLKKSTVIQNTLDDNVWPKLGSGKVTPPTYDTPLRIVYMGTVTHSEDFEMIVPALDRLHEEMPGRFKLSIIGVSVELKDKPWIEVLKPTSAIYPDFIKWFSELPQFDIGLSPLINSSFNTNKSDIKCLDYLANGIVPVVSDVPAYKNPELDDLIIRVGNSTDEWYEALLKQINTVDNLRENMIERSKRGFDYINENRSTGVAAREILDSFQKHLGVK